MQSIREMEQNGGESMYNRPKSPLHRGLDVLSAAAASHEEDRASVIQSTKVGDQHQRSATPSERPEHSSGHFAERASGSKSKNTATAGKTNAHQTPRSSEHRDGSELPLETTLSTFHSPHAPQTTNQQLGQLCPFYYNHSIGKFCFNCRCMEMPWRDIHPVALDTNGNKIQVPPQGTLLEGVRNLNEPYEIAQLALLVEFRIIEQDIATIPGLVATFKYFPHLHDVAHRIADMVKELRTLANEGESERVPKWFDTLHELLKNPNLTHDQYFAQITGDWNFQAKNATPPIQETRISTRVFTGIPVMLTVEDAINYENNRDERNEADARQLMEHLHRNESRGPGYVQFTFDFVSWLREGAHSTGKGAPQWSPRYAQEYYKYAYPASALAPGTNNNGTRSRGRLNFSNRRNSTPTTPRCSEEASDVELYDSNDDEEELEGAYFRKLPEVKKNTPGRANVTWRFVEGTDITNAQLGNPDPSKFYLTRQNVDDPEEVDLRQYAQIAGFDWNDPADIKKLNKARAQNRKRTYGNVAETRIPWTQLEKDKLMEEVKDAIRVGETRHTIDWDEIADRLRQRFDGFVQKKGSKLAPGVEREPKNGKKDRTLKTSRSDRVGYSRTGSATETQALKYPDILKLVNDATGIGGKGGRGVLRGPRRLSQAAGDEKESNSRSTKEATHSPHRSFSQAIDDEQDKDVDSPTKKRKSVRGSGTMYSAQTKELSPVAKRAFELPSYNFVHMFNDVYDDGNDRPSKKPKVIHRRYSSDAAPHMLKKQYNDEEDNGTPPSPSRPSALNAAFGLRLPKSSAKQFDTTSSRR
ncbi:uncharacterized protein EAE97_011835 [Botrytis byssoidea]|uniref:Uncharacterized protein n=1 Tax=Botrytis byssoidea TaxID=139641 RepID=A0A9P5LGG8_9HELO|nr:uncharacterized protein EAE97_011835 [Botrytis byssoidea]KAF7918740.1 hypothetical protein EAE97_011835 [Botrytis byssoidea]